LGFCIATTGGGAWPTKMRRPVGRLRGLPRLRGPSMSTRPGGSA